MLLCTVLDGDIFRDLLGRTFLIDVCLMKERVTISQLHNHFDEVDPADVKGHYGHKMYGYLIPPEPGK